MATKRWWCVSVCICSCAEWSLSRTRRQLASVLASIQQESARVPPFCGLAFVTFARPETQQQFLLDWGRAGTQSPPAQLPSSEKTAPQPSSRKLAAQNLRTDLR